MKSQYEMYVDNIEWKPEYRFDDEVKDDDHGVFTPEILKLPQSTWM